MAGTISFTNAVGTPMWFMVTIDGFTVINQAIKLGETVTVNYKTKKSDQFKQMYFNAALLDGNGQGEFFYTTDMNRDHFFGDNENVFPGSDTDTSFTPYGFYHYDDTQKLFKYLRFVYAYRRNSLKNSPFLSSNDLKQLSRP